ncbi:MFS transporter [Methylovirgula sp. 4M-Z18]|uniref:MFS transporter n=1 Tax=Methylovirgula sp. 4M-Z18 TaxID=2293567 RepID=UPI000E2F9E43|nr:MFS transporter [Methylovirgula sp. 4M-Z18]RFB80782.1 MFS transporter [Methylovirgula sp. 4M-Z18]
MSAVNETNIAHAQRAATQTVLAVLVAISVSHCLNDIIQSLIPAIYPILKDSYALDYGQIGLITLAFQGTASLLQPVVGLYTDKYPKPYSLPIGMCSTLIGLVTLSYSSSFASILLSVSLIGLGSAIFHPEASRVARMASGGRHGLAQSLFQVGGYGGTALGPLLAAYIVLPHGQHSIIWFSAVALTAIGLLSWISTWYARHRAVHAAKKVARLATHIVPKHHIPWLLVLLGVLVFSKALYMASMSSYYTFYLIHRFGVPTQHAQVMLFIFLAAVATGTLFGGPFGDRVGRKFVIWFSILGVLPFTLALPYANLFWTGVLSVLIGLILSSAFSAIVVYAQELVPTKVGLIAGLFFGLTFGLGGIGAAILGDLADRTSIEYVYQVCSFLPAIGLLAMFLPNLKQARVS